MKWSGGPERHGSLVRTCLAAVSALIVFLLGRSMLLRIR